MDSHSQSRWILHGAAVLWGETLATVARVPGYKRQITQGIQKFPLVMQLQIIRNQIYWH